MKVADIMTRDVISVRPEASIHEAARLMVDHLVSGLPVVDDDGAVIGILSEGDLIVRQKPRRRASWWTGFFQDGEQLARDYQKAVGTTVGEVMTRAVVSVAPDLSIEAAAAMLDELRIRRLPVVANGRLEGIVSRADLIKVLARPPDQVTSPPADAKLVGEMRDRLNREVWVSSRGIVIQAREGIMTLLGLVDSDVEKSAIAAMARSIEGCKGIENQLVLRPNIMNYGA